MSYMQSTQTNDKKPGGSYMTEPEFSITKISKNWYIGRGHQVAFFGTTPLLLAQRHQNYVRSTQTISGHLIRSAHIASKILGGSL